jgi:hypothetical protein
MIANWLITKMILCLCFLFAKMVQNVALIAHFFEGLMYVKLIVGGFV